VEANASGTPVIAYGAGGVLDTGTWSNRSFFKRQTPDALKLHSLMLVKYDGKIRNHALSQFSEEAFFSRVEQVIEEVCSSVNYKFG